MRLEAPCLWLVAATPLFFASAARADEPVNESSASSPRSIPAAPVVTAQGLPVVTESPVGVDSNALAGYHGGLFFLRDHNDNFRLYIQGRAQIDMVNSFGTGVADTANKSSLFLKRIRPELSGEFLKVWQFQLSGDWGQTGNDNAAGTNETSAAKPGVTPTATTGAYAGPQTATVRSGPTDVFLIFHPAREFNVQAGQFDAPFSMENRTSDKYLAFMERSLAVRALGVPTNKEIGAMVWGETEDHLLFYSVGVFNGDGQNRLSPDNRGDLIGRVFAHPLARSKDVTRDLQIGVSARYGVRDRNYVNYDYPAMTTQGGYTFWKPTYAGSKGTTHILPSNIQSSFAAEFRLPVSIVDLTGEFVYVDNQTRESVEGYQASNVERTGEIKGYGYYAQLGVWVYGERDVNGLPGYENPPHVDLSKADPVKPLTAVQLLLKWEQLRVNYNGSSRAGDPDPKNIDGDIKVDAFSLGANYWATKHVRLTVNYVLSMFPDSKPTGKPTAGTQNPTQDSGQRAQAPGNTLGPAFASRDDAHSLHELLFRAAVAF